MSTREAVQLARSQGLDLVEVAATADPPVCRIIDYGKFTYEQKKKASEAKKKQRSEEHTSELQSRSDLVCRLLLEKKKKALSLQHLSENEVDALRTATAVWARLRRVWRAARSCSKQAGVCRFSKAERCAVSRSGRH